MRTDELGVPALFTEAARFQSWLGAEAVLGRAAHHRRPLIKARLEGLGRVAVAVTVLPLIGVHKDVGAAMQLGLGPARRLELEAAGTSPGDGRAFDAVARQQVAGPPGSVGSLRTVGRMCRILCGAIGRSFQRRASHYRQTLNFCGLSAIACFLRIGIQDGCP